MAGRTIFAASSLSGVASTANTDQIWTVIGRIQVTATGSIAQRECKIRSAGTLSNLVAHVTANSVAAISTFTLQKNGANGTQALSVSSSGTGNFEDTSGTDTIAATDRVCLKTHPGAATGTYSINIISEIFTADADTVTILGVETAPTTYSVASTTNYIPIQGQCNATQGTEANVKQRFRKAGTLKYLGCYVSSNRAQTSTLRLRKNGTTNGNNAVSITGGGAAGWYEDTSSSDTVTVDDDWNYSITTGTGTDNLIMQTVKCEFVNTSNFGMIVASFVTPATITDGTNRFYTACGTASQATTETGATGIQLLARKAFVCSELLVYVTQNDVGSASTLDFRVNAAVSALTASITASTTGIFKDSTNSVTLAAGDLICYQVTVPAVSGTHTVTVANLGVTTELAATNAYTTTLATETVSVSDSIARMLAATRNPVETTNISETPTRMLSAFRTLPETTSISEDLVKSKGQPSRLSTETVTIGETLARMLAATRNPQETTAISEALTRMLAANRSLDIETVTVGGGSVAVVHGFVRTLATETVTVGESLTRMLAANRTLSDTVPVSDSVARMLAATRTLTTETTAISDSISRMLAATRTLSDTITIGENLTKQLAASRSLATETTNITEQLNRMLAATRVISQTVSISEQLDYTYTAGGGGPTNYQRTITETTSISESLLRMLAATRALAAENTAISENLQRSVGRNRTINENVSIGESLTRKLDAFRTNIESTTVGESLNRMLAATRAIPTQTVSIGESLVRQLGATRTLIENTVSSENLSRQLSALRTLIETTSISDILDYVYGAVGARHYFVELIENVSVSDSVRTWIEYFKIFPGKDAARQKVETVPDKRKSPQWWRISFYLPRRTKKGSSNKSEI